MPRNQDLVPEGGYKFNTGVGVLPQFQQPPIDPTDLGNPLNTDVGQQPQPSYPAPTPPPQQYYSQPSSPFNSAGSGFNGISSSAGGWNIDQYGNLQNTAVQTGQNIGRTVGGFLGGDLGRYVPLPGAPQLGAFLGRQAGSLLGHGIGGLFGSIGNGLKNLFNSSGGDNTTPPQDAPANTSPQYNPGPTPIGRGWQDVFNTGRFPGAPAFAPNLDQLQFPGSMIGPTTGGPSSYNPATMSSPSRYGGSHSTIGGSARVMMNQMMALPK